MGVKLLTVVQVFPGHAFYSNDHDLHLLSLTVHIITVWMVGRSKVIPIILNKSRDYAPGPFSF